MSTLQLTGFAAQDFGTLINGLANGPSNPVTVNLTLTWNSRIRFRDETNGFTGLFMGEPTTIQWSATGTAPAFTFTSDPPSPDTQFDSFSTVSRLRNGVFFQ